MIFDEKNICVGFQDPLIHVFNKNEAGVTDNTHYEVIKNRNNVIVLGDSIGDLRMADGLEHEVNLSIGFLNHDTQLHLEKYMDMFDIVIIDDSSFEIVNDILNGIKSGI